MGEKKSFPVLTILVLVGTGAFVFYHLWHTLVPFLVSFAAAYVLTPLINRWQLRGFKRGFGVLVLYAAAACVLGLVASSLFQIATGELRSLQTDGPAYAAKLKVFMTGLQAKASAKLPFGGDVVSQVNDAALSPLMDQAANIPHYLLGFFPLLELVFLIPFITFFLLLDGPDSVDALIQACPSRFVEQAMHLLSEIDTSLGNYLRGLIIVDCVVAAAAFIGLVTLGVSQALWIALLAGAMSFLPIMGAATGALVGGLVAWVQFGTFAAFLKVLALFGIIHVCNETMLQPYIAKHSAHLHPLVFLLSFLLGGEFFGFLGLIFAVPFVCILKSLIKVAWSWYSSEAQLQGTEAFDLADVPYT